MLVQAAPTVAETEFLLRVGARQRRARARGRRLGRSGGARCRARRSRGSRATRCSSRCGRCCRTSPDPEWILRPEVRPRAAGAAAARPALRRAGQARAAAGAAAHARPPSRSRRGHRSRRRSRRSPPDAGSRGPSGDRGAGAAPAGRIASCRVSSPKPAPAGASRRSRRYVDHLLACFGPARLLWGSDWPVVDLAGGYRRWVAATDSAAGRAVRRRPRRDPRRQCAAVLRRLAMAAPTCARQ